MCATGGLPLCPTHHRAFDLGLFVIDPNTLAIAAISVRSEQDLQISVEDIGWLNAVPDPEALQWRIDHAQSGKG